ncbi:MAG TPA: GAF domain-containing protein [Gemmatimonadales bacterium]|nr:GAF domain-containing protein [Gemmatimonadales bacterium]
MALSQAEFRELIPLLHPRTRLEDMDVLKAWYEAIADTVRAEIPADLFAIWIYAPDGEPLLLEPEALREDNLEVPRAEPIARQNLLDELENRIRRAGYGSVVLRPIRHGGQDVGLFLLASFTPHLYGIRAEALVETAADVLAPMLARVTRAGAAEEHPGESAVSAALAGAATERVRDRARRGDLLETLSDAIGGAGTPRDLMLALSFALQPVLPHDSYELLISDAADENCYRLGLHGHGPLWSEASLILPKAALDAGRLFESKDWVLIDDTLSAPETLMPEFITVRGPEGPPRSVVGVTLRVVERMVGYFLLGSGGPGFYSPQDSMLLDRVAALLAPRIEGLVTAWQCDMLRAQLDDLRSGPNYLSRATEVLASMAFLGEGSRMVVEEAMRLLPVSDVEFAVRLMDEHRVAVVKPGATTPLADLPQEPIEGTGVALVVRDEVPFLSRAEEGSGSPAVLVVPLRSGGRTFGAMALTCRLGSRFSGEDINLAQQLADLVAPHLDLARRGGGPAAPYLPGWKRPTPGPGSNPTR